MHRLKIAVLLILSNGNQHYLWDLQRGNPNIISTSPTPETVLHYKEFKPNPQNVVNEVVKEDYVAITQKPDYTQDPQYIDEAQRKNFLEENKLSLLRKYQVRAIERIQEMARTVFFLRWQQEQERL